MPLAKICLPQVMAELNIPGKESIEEPNTFAMKATTVDQEVHPEDVQVEDRGKVDLQSVEVRSLHLYCQHTR